MLPANLDTKIKIIKYPSDTYLLNINTNVIQQKLYNKENLKQSIYCILNTERFRHLIYSKNYGIQLQDLFGKAPRTVIPIIQKRISNALIVDDRINSVYDFDFEIIDKNIVVCNFKVDSIFGDLTIEEVKFLV